MFRFQTFEAQLPPSRLNPCATTHFGPTKPVRIPLLPHFFGLSSHRVPSASLLACAFALLGPTLSPAQSAGGGWETLSDLRSSQLDSTFGSVISILTDLDGDGYAEILVASPKASVGGIAGAGAVFLYHGGDGALLHEWHGTVPQAGFGSALCSIDDLNGDGTPDLLIGAPGEPRSSLTEAGAVYCMSGADYSRLFTYRGNFSGDRVGSSVAAAGDVDLDGTADFLVGGPGRSPTSLTAAGEVRLISGRTWHTIQYFKGEYFGGRLGTTVLGVGDQNADAIPDLLMAAPLATANGQSASGRIRLHSGADGALLQEWFGTTPTARLGSAMAAADLNQDQIPELLFGAPGTLGTTGTPLAGMDGVGEVRLMEGGTWQQLWQRNGTQEYAFFGDALSTTRGSGMHGWRAPGGQSGIDGLPGEDVLIGAPGLNHNGISDCGAVYVIDAALNEISAVEYGSQSQAQFGSQLAVSGDVDGDAEVDLLVQSPNRSTAQPQLRFHSWKPYLKLSNHEVSATSGGILFLKLSFPISEAGQAVRVVASASGPGLTHWRGVDLPIVADALTSNCLSGNAHWFPHSVQLDAAGQKTVRLVIPSQALSAFAGNALRLVAVSHQGLGSPRMSSAVALLNVNP